MCGAADDAEFETTKAMQSKTSCKLGLTESASFTDERVALLLVSFCFSRYNQLQYTRIPPARCLPSIKATAWYCINQTVLQDGSLPWLPITLLQQGSYRLFYDQAVGDDFCTVDVVLLVNLSEHSMLEVRFIDKRDVDLEPRVSTRCPGLCCAQSIFARCSSVRCLTLHVADGLVQAW